MLSVAQSLKLDFNQDLTPSTGALHELLNKRGKPRFAFLNHEDDECKERKFTVLEGLSATGLRSVRYAKELNNVSSIVANDLDSDAVEAITENILLNNVQDKVVANHGNALY